MTASMIVNAILMLGVAIMVVSPLVWAIRTAHRDRPLPVVNTRMRPARTAHRPRRPERAPRYGGARAGQPSPTA